MKKKFFVSGISAVFLLIFSVSGLIAGTTGKIAGRVTDATTGEPLIGANVIVVGTMLGAATDMDGYYTILRVSPGVHSVEISYIGYKKNTFQDVKVSVDLTTQINAELSPEAFEGEEIIVTAEAPVITKDLTATTSRVSSQEMEQLPITEISEALAIQAGYVDGHVRGGRTGEIAYWIDGIPITDVYDGSTVVDVNKDMVQEMQFISGAFNAEYGRAMSGIVNIITKSGTNKFSGNITAYNGDFLSGHNDIFPYIDNIDPFAIRNVEGSLSGPVWKDKISFSVNARYIHFSGYHYGQRRFNNFNYAGFDDEDVFQLYYTPEGQGDGEYVPMNWNRKIYLQGKLSYQISPGIQFSLSSIIDDVDHQEFNSLDNERNFKYNPDGAPRKFRRGTTHIVKLVHTLSSNTFYEIGLSYFNKNFQKYLYEDPNDSRYVPRDYGAYLLIQQPYSYYSGGTNYSRFDRETETYLAKIDITSQVSRFHQLKSGIEFRRNRAFQEDYAPPIEGIAQDIEGIDPNQLYYYSKYDHKPIEFSGYIQDKMEFGELIINAGVRFDYFDPDGFVLRDESDPNIYNPIRPENRYNDLNSNGVQDSGEPDVTFEERKAYWYKDAESNLQISPRFGAAFPITDRGVFHFSYGHFFQIPSFQRLYQNPSFVIGSGTGNQGVIGNANLKPEMTVSGEIGVQQQITDDISLDITGYFRDVRDLTGTRADEIIVYGEFARYSKLVNSDFGIVRGIVLSLNKQFPSGLSTTFDYTYQVAKGSNSDPEGARNAILGGAQPEVQLTPLDWDQRHTLNASVSYNGSSWGGSVIGQYGSGQPYTPRRSQDISSLLTNSQSKPQFSNVDVRLYKDINISNYRIQGFMRVLNLFDTLNETTVYDDTGRAGFTTDLLRARQQNTPEYINTVEEWFLNPHHYSEPRRIEMGFTISF